MNIVGADRTDRIVIAVTKKGSQLALDLAAQLPARVLVPLRFLESPMDPRGYLTSVSQVVQEAFVKYSALILIMASGVAVRSVAPVLRDKRTDPAVIVLDEEGRFVISLLSGHLGGANRLAEEIAGLTGGTAVITTASDLNKLPSLDLLAKRLHLGIENSYRLTEFAGAIVNGDPLVLWDRWGLPEQWPEHVRVVNGPDLTLSAREKFLIIAGYQEYPSLPSGTAVLALRPACLVVGIGCCKGVPGVKIIGAIRRYFRERHWATGSIKTIATIDLKAQEPGIVEACQEFKVPLVTFSEAKLQTVMTGLQHSDFVEDTVGVGGVCEPAAILGAGNGRLIGTKDNLGQITLAVALLPGH
ncbi:cobalt-precorrin 5A acetaldehyde-lyase [Hydrogenispora ethanolica]|uniref:Cobalt-precorrin 5A acetaldehyde-lyase n=1 Tax=Hydrogenispora ethanolica TaxID=1082276 RepID=A0A4R1S4Z4_HYDET|nr:cobalamin biosynthesis protein [Hydrogenispora ethanolica]TCL74074.1 cobalt-precorrin 5A acetaldehyde-lyase [Hydrogenispora ethanolica]